MPDHADLSQQLARLHPLDGKPHLGKAWRAWRQLLGDNGTRLAELPGHSPFTEVRIIQVETDQDNFQPSPELARTYERELRSLGRKDLVQNPQSGAYQIGLHRYWIERRAQRVYAEIERVRASTLLDGGLVALGEMALIPTGSYWNEKPLVEVTRQVSASIDNACQRLANEKNALVVIGRPEIVDTREPHPAWAANALVVFSPDQPRRVIRKSFLYWGSEASAFDPAGRVLQFGNDLGDFNEWGFFAPGQEDPPVVTLPNGKHVLVINCHEFKEIAQKTPNEIRRRFQLFHYATGSPLDNARKGRTRTAAPIAHELLGKEVRGSAGLESIRIDAAGMQALARGNRTVAEIGDWLVWHDLLPANADREAVAAALFDALDVPRPRWSPNEFTNAEQSILNRATDPPDENALALLNRELRQAIDLDAAVDRLALDPADGRRLREILLRPAASDTLTRTLGEMNRSLAELHAALVSKTSLLELAVRCNLPVGQVYAGLRVMGAPIPRFSAGARIARERFDSRFGPGSWDRMADDAEACSLRRQQQYRDPSFWRALSGIVWATNYDNPDPVFGCGADVDKIQRNISACVPEHPLLYICANVPSMKDSAYGPKTFFNGVYEIRSDRPFVLAQASRSSDGDRSETSAQLVFERSAS